MRRNLFARVVFRGRSCRSRSELLALQPSPNSRNLCSSGEPSVQGLIVATVKPDLTALHRAVHDLTEAGFAHAGDPYLPCCGLPALAVHRVAPSRLDDGHWSVFSRCRDQCTVRQTHIQLWSECASLWLVRVRVPSDAMPCVRTQQPHDEPLNCTRSSLRSRSSMRGAALSVR